MRHKTGWQKVLGGRRSQVGTSLTRLLKGALDADFTSYLILILNTHTDLWAYQEGQFF